MLGAVAFAAWNALARRTLCKLGIHTVATGHGLDACARGCGHFRNPDAAQLYTVTLKDGTVQHVRAISTVHAENLVAYGGAPVSVNPDGTVRGEMKVHRANIRSIELAPNPRATQPTGAPLRD